MISSHVKNIFNSPLDANVGLMYLNRLAGIGRDPVGTISKAQLIAAEKHNRSFTMAQNSSNDSDDRPRDDQGRFVSEDDDQGSKGGSQGSSKGGSQGGSSSGGSSGGSKSGGSSGGSSSGGSKSGSGSSSGGGSKSSGGR
jgi:hypothetical protein